MLDYRCVAKRTASKSLNEVSEQQKQINKHNKLECGPMPNVMVALPNIGGALCSTPQFG